MYMAHVCSYVCCSDCVGMCGNVCCVAAVFKKYVVCLCRGCDGCCVFCLYCEARSCRCSCMGSMSVVMEMYDCVLCAFYGSSQCCVLHDLKFLNAGRGCNRRPYRRGILQSRSHNCFIGSHVSPSVYPILLQ